MGKISSYPAMTALQGPELILGDQSGATGTTTPTAVAAYMAGLTTTPVLASYARTAAEIAAGVTPTNYSYAPGDIRRYGASTASSDNSGAINAALSVWTASGVFGVVYIPPGTWNVAAGISVNASYVKIVSDGAILNFSSLTSGSAITLTGTINPPYDQTRSVLSGLKISGNGASGGGTGIHLYSSSTSGAGPSHLGIAHCSMANFGTGLLYDANSYIVGCYGVDVYACGTGVSIANAANSGSTLTFYAGSIFNCTTYGLWNQNTAADIYLFGTSLGGCGSSSSGALVRADAGTLLLDCHLESQNGERALYVPSTAGTTIITCSGQATQDVSTAAPLFDVSGPGLLTLVGGLAALNSGSTGAIVSITDGAYARLGTHFVIASGQTAESIGSGVKTVSISPTSADFSVNFSSTVKEVEITDGVVNTSSNQVVVTALSTYVTLLTTGGSGLLVLSDLTSGGTAVYAVDSGLGSAVSITGNIAGLTVTYSGTTLELELTTGTVPRTLGWGLFQTKS